MNITYKQRVLLFGASGTLGFETFKQLWLLRDRYDIVLLLLPRKTEKRLFRCYERDCGINSISGKGLVKGKGLKIVWGDAAEYDDVLEAVSGVDWVLNAMAYISPMADYYPERARAANVTAVENILKAIAAQPDGNERIRYVHIGTVAETGDRLPQIHFGRVGDPLKPSVFDYYAITKIEGERMVLESDIRHWVSMRMTFLMPTDYRKLFSLEDPIMFHMPLNTCMENISDQDAGQGMINTLNVPDDSDFWRKVYNFGGGPGMRTDATTYYDRIYQLLGLSGVRAISEPNWYATRNFHLHYFTDSQVLNDYLNYWRDDLDSYFNKLQSSMPYHFRVLRFLCLKSGKIQHWVERITYRRLKSMAERHRNGPLHWIQNRNKDRISAFFTDYSAYTAIQGWEEQPRQKTTPHTPWRLDHGYDETKAQLEICDLQQAATFRGGKCLASEWNGDFYHTLDWQCGFGHSFRAKVYTVLKTGHWCPVCVNPPWNFDQQARISPFLAQVWYPNHSRDEDKLYEESCIEDILEADQAFRKSAKK